MNRLSLKFFLLGLGQAQRGDLNIPPRGERLRRASKLIGCRSR